MDSHLLFGWRVDFVCDNCDIEVYAHELMGVACFKTPTGKHICGFCVDELPLSKAVVFFGLRRVRRQEPT